MITIRMGAAHYDITTPEGDVVDLASMTKDQRNKTRRIIRDWFELQQQKGNA